MRTALALVALLLVSCGAAGPANQPARSTSPSPVFVATVAPDPTLDPAVTQPGRLEMFEFPVGAGQGPHDVAPAVDGGVWYTAQRTGELGYLDPKTGAFKMTKLGNGSAPHGVIVGPDGNPWITDGGLNAIVRVDAKTKEVTRYQLPAPNVNLNTAAFGPHGVLWFTGQSGYFGSVDPRDGKVTVVPAPRGPGPYGMTATPAGNIYYASLAGNHIARVVLTVQTEGPAPSAPYAAVPIDPPTGNQGARRIWSDSTGALWVSEWNAGQVARFDGTSWKEWRLPGANPMAYAVYVDDQEIVWLTDFGANAIVRFDPKTEKFTSLPHSAPNAAVRQLLGRPGEVWGAMSGQDKLLLVKTR
jgi:virginiamycin B lyase